ncbi:MAG: heme-binding protein [Limnohabitans sp.]|nr:heme-binding protein [Limnohabitans sp.]
MLNIHWESVQLALSAAADKAQQLEVAVNIALVDASGVMVGFLRMNNAPLHSIDIALDKAYTAVSFGVPTGQWTDILKNHSPAARNGLVARDRFVGFSGGLPLQHEGARIGGIGVSGGSEEQDEIIARVGAEAIINNK